MSSRAPPPSPRHSQGLLGFTPGFFSCPTFLSPHPPPSRHPRRSGNPEPQPPSFSPQREPRAPAPVIPDAAGTQSPSPRHSRRSGNPEPQPPSFSPQRESRAPPSRHSRRSGNPEPSPRHSRRSGNPEPSPRHSRRSGNPEPSPRHSRRSGNCHPTRLGNEGPGPAAVHPPRHRGAGSSHPAIIGAAPVSRRPPAFPPALPGVLRNISILHGR